MRRVIIAILVLFCGLPLAARVVGVVIRFRGSVFIRKTGQSGLRRVYSRQPVRDSSRLIIRKRGSVALLLFSGKILSLKKPGSYRVSAKNMLVTYNDVLRHHRRISRSGLSSGVGATRGKFLAYKPHARATGQVQIIHPKGYLQDTYIRLNVKKNKKGAVITDVRILNAAGLVYRGEYTSFARGLHISTLQPGGRYRCQIRYTINNRKYRVHSVFRIMNPDKKSAMKKQLAAIQGRGLSGAVRNYLQSVVYARYGLNRMAKVRLRRAVSLDSRLR